MYFLSSPQHFNMHIFLVLSTCFLPGTIYNNIQSRVLSAKQNFLWLGQTEVTWKNYLLLLRNGKNSTIWHLVLAFSQIPLPSLFPRCEFKEQLTNEVTVPCTSHFQTLITLLRVYISHLDPRKKCEWDIVHLDGFITGWNITPKKQWLTIDRYKERKL